MLMGLRRFWYIYLLVPEEEQDVAIQRFINAPHASGSKELAKMSTRKRIEQQVHQTAEGHD